MHQYHNDNGYFPSGFYMVNTLLGFNGWQYPILPYLEQNTMYQTNYEFCLVNQGNNYVVDGPTNPIADFQCPIFICPSNPRPVSFLNTPPWGTTFTASLTSYMGCAGTTSNPVSGDGILFAASQVRFAQITDGTSNTILVGERPVTGDLELGWGFVPAGYPNSANVNVGDADTVLGSQDAYVAYLGGDWTSNTGLQPPRDINDTGELDVGHFWSYHDGGANFLFGDGSVHFLPYAANSVFPALCTIASNESVALPF